MVLSHCTKTVIKNGFFLAVFNAFLFKTQNHTGSRKADEPNIIKILFFL